MKALTLLQPWATLVAIGAKTLETRSWHTDYRGPLAIHAGKDKRFVDGNSPYYICCEEPFYTVLQEHGRTVVEKHRSPFEIADRIMPLGAVIAVCELVECLKIICPPAEPECSFGDFSLGRWAWFLNNVQILDKPVPARGSLGLWEWNYEKGKE